MPEQLICHAGLQDQRKAIIQLYLFQMGTLAIAVLSDVDESEKFMNAVRESNISHQGFMKGFIRAAEEQYPHVAIPAYPDWSKGTTYTVKCKFCKCGLGWHCPDNKNGYCEYNPELGGWEGESCIHCGSPEERK